MNYEEIVLRVLASFLALFAILMMIAFIIAGAKLFRRYLGDFMSKKNTEIPTEQTLKDLKESEEDYKAGRFVSFEHGKDALVYLDKIIKEKQNY